MNRCSVYRLTVSPSFLLAAVLLLAGCESTHIAPATAPGSRLEADERRIWASARVEQTILNRSGFLLHDPTSEKYLAEILARLQVPALGENAKLDLKILIDPALNAFALPDGTIYLHSGLIAAAQNEAQLVAIIGHELTHATHRHHLKSHRDLKNKSAFAIAFTAGTAGAGALLGVFGAAAAVSGYSQDLEREADNVGFRLLVASGYDAREAPKVFQLMLEETRRSKIREPFFFGSHPRLAERLASFEQLVAALPPAANPGRIGLEDYEQRMAEVFLRNAEAAQQAGAVDLALAHCARFVRVRPDDSRGALLLAEIHRKRDSDPTEAHRLYRELLTQHSELPAAHRGLGLVLLKQNDPSGAGRSLRRYLELDPAAPDRTFVEALLQQCESKP